MPVSGLSNTITKPESCQNSRTTGHTFAGSSGTTSHRWLPDRSMRTLPPAGSTSLEPVRGWPARSDWYVDSVALLLGLTSGTV